MTLNQALHGYWKSVAWQIVSRGWKEVDRKVPKTIRKRYSGELIFNNGLQAF
jgi:hypothetical protein